MLRAEKGIEVRETLRGGDTVIASDGVRKVEARVARATRNGGWLLIEFEGMLAGHAGSMKILQYAGKYRSAVDNAPITLTRIPSKFEIGFFVDGDPAGALE